MSYKKFEKELPVVQDSSTKRMMNSCVDEMLCRQNVPSTKCSVDEMFCRRDALSTKCFVDENLSTKHHVDEMPCRRSVCRQKIFDEMRFENSCRRNVCRRKCQSTINMGFYAGIRSIVTNMDLWTGKYFSRS